MLFLAFSFTFLSLSYYYHRCFNLNQQNRLTVLFRTPSQERNRVSDFAETVFHHCCLHCRNPQIRWDTPTATDRIPTEICRRSTTACRSVMLSAELHGKHPTAGNPAGNSTPHWTLAGICGHHRLRPLLLCNSTNRTQHIKQLLLLLLGGDRFHHELRPPVGPVLNPYPHNSVCVCVLAQGRGVRICMCICVCCEQSLSSLF